MQMPQFDEVQKIVPQVIREQLENCKLQCQVVMGIATDVIANIITK